MSGKAYANRKARSQRPEGDFYSTPASLIWVLLDNAEIPLIEKWKKKPPLFSHASPKPTFYDPAVGEGAILKALGARGYEGRGTDLYPGEGFKQRDFLTSELNFDPKKEILLFNPPFSQFDEFILRAKEIAPYFISLGRMNYFGTHKRNTTNMWRNLKEVLVFDRMVDYRTPARDDGHFYVGALVTCWMIFDKTWKEPYWKTRALDVSDWATLGSYEEK